MADVAVADRLEPEGADGAAVELIDVRYADGGEERYAIPLRGEAECGADDPLWPALVRAAGLESGLVTDRYKAPGFLAEDLSNTVVVLEGAVVLKLYRRPERGAHPEAELLAALEGSPHVPRLLGSLERDGATLVVLQSLVDGDPVGWEPFISRLAGGDGATGEPAEMARVAANLHALLAERLGVAAAREPGLVTISYKAAVEQLPRELGPLRGRIEARLAPLADLAGTPLQRVHGDLNVAQFLRTGNGLVVVDWEGEPGLPLAERARPRPALRDLATLRLSLAHAARAAYRRNDGFDWRGWSSQARREAADAYADAAGPLDRELLHALELEKELSELSYAERWLPEWSYVPRDVLPFVLDEGP